MAGREVREYTNLSDPKDKKWGKGKERIDDEDITFQRMVAKLDNRNDAFVEVILITCPGRDLGFSYWVVDVHRCKKLPVNVVAIYMDVAPWTVMICSISRSRWKRRRMQNGFYVAPRNGHLLLLKAASLADSSPALVPLPLRVEPKPKSGIRQQDLLKKVVEVKPKRQRVSSQHRGNESTLVSNLTNHKSEAKVEEKNCPTVQSKAGDEIEVANPVKSLLAAYESSDTEED